MRKPDGFEDSEAREGGFRQPAAGPCILEVINASIQAARDSGEQVLFLSLDIAEGAFKGYYAGQSERFGADRMLRFYQNTEGKGLPYFKGIVSAFEGGNAPFKFQWNETELIEKKIGANLREHEWFSQRLQQVIPILKVEYLCSIRSIKAGEHKVLPIKKLKVNPAPADGFGPGPEQDFDQAPPPEENLPF